MIRGKKLGFENLKSMNLKNTCWYKLLDKNCNNMIWFEVWDLEILLKQKYLRYYGFDIFFFFFFEKVKDLTLSYFKSTYSKKKKSSKSFIKPTGKMYHLIFYSNNLN